MSASSASVSNARWWCEDSVVDSFDFTLARDTETLEQAFRLVHDRYVEYGYMKADSSRRRLSLFHAIPSTKVFVAKDGGRVTATLTLIQDSALGLPMDKLYRDHLNLLRARGRRLAEVSALAMDSRCGARGVLIVMRLIRATYAFAASVAGLQEVCVAVNPRHVDFYRNALHFQEFGQLKPYSTVNGAPAVALRFDLDWARERMARLAAGKTPGGELLEEFFFSPAAFARTLSGLGPEPMRVLLTTEQFLHFFGKDALGKEGDDEVRQVIRTFYPELSSGALEGRSASLAHAGAAGAK